LLHFLWRQIERQDDFLRQLPVPRGGFDLLDAGLRRRAWNKWIEVVKKEELTHIT
jgi:hypothetical protein